MSILSIDLHSSKCTIRLSFHFQIVTYESFDDIYCSKFSTGCNPHVLGWRLQPCVSSLQLDVGYPVVIAAAIPDAILLPTDECSRACIRRPNMSQICSMGFNGRPSDVQQLSRTSLLYACRLFTIFVLLIFVFVSCLLRMNTFFKTPNLNTQIRSVDILNFE